MGGDAAELTLEYIRRLLPPREKDSHKGANGRALIIAGSEQYAGAALMSAAAALRAGTGVLTVCVPKAIRAEFFTLPEAICLACGEGGNWDRAALDEAIAALDGKTAAAIGPGMGAMADGSLLLAALERRLPIVLDADALNFLSNNPDRLSKLHPSAVLTPHPGEMARLTGLSIEAVTADPAAAAAEYAEKWNCTLLLKGAKSHIAGAGRLAVNVTGNPGLAKGGSGDVLTGLALAMLSQGLSAFDAACAASFLLGCSADAAVEALSNRMLLARDVIDMVELTLKTTI